MYAVAVIVGVFLIIREKKYSYFIYLTPFILLFAVMFYKNYVSIFEWSGMIRALHGRYYLFASLPLFILMGKAYGHIYERFRFKKILLTLSLVLLVFVEARLFLNEYLTWIYF